MSLKTTNKVCDFFIRVIMMVSTILVLALFGATANTKVGSITVTSVLLLYLVALIVKGITDFLIARKK